jgi:hypothetical protein
MVSLIVALLIMLAAAGQLAATREEEAEGYLDHLLARPAARIPWLAGRFAVSAAVLASAGLATGLLTWVGAVTAGAGMSLPTLLTAGLNTVPPGILVLGAGNLIHALAPRPACGGTASPSSPWSVSLPPQRERSHLPAVTCNSRRRVTAAVCDSVDTATRGSR